eukprot:CAMPEP_0119157504 /NCGR_PEP_ID=MMETSP1310-20130426/52787_1 /TAXON_ID=464262 /ORGANISM="Genus nov. species nov., Strain RCC2339" /LENGTH=785 /DNA_ID=CAMNT_0007150123 /DNA_START=47 /DNA_END=2404 /DNA_ORIENTATION=+
MLRKSKYKRITKAVFPESEDSGIVSHEVGNLLHYAATTPSKLPKIGKWLEKKGKTELERKHYSQVEVVMDAFNKLIDACDDHLTLFAINCLNMIEACFLDKNSKIKIVARETFVRFVSVQNVSGQFQISHLVHQLIDMANTPVNETLSEELRLAGLSGLQVYVAMVDDFDSVMLKHVAVDRGGQLMGTVLENIYRVFKKDPSMKFEDEEVEYVAGKATDSSGNLELGGPETWALKCLKCLASRVNNITVRTLIAALLDFLDSRNLWAPRAFALHITRYCMEYVQRQHHYNVLTALLSHIGEVQEPLIKTNMVLVIAHISEYSPPALVHESMTHLVDHLLFTLSLEKDRNERQELEEVNQLQKALIQCMSVIAENSHDLSQKGEALEFILEYIRAEKNSSAHVKLLLRALQPQVLHILSVMNGMDFPVFELVLSVARNPDRTIRLRVQKLLHASLTHPNAAKILKLDAAGASSGDVPEGKRLASEEELGFIRSSLFQDLTILSNEPENIHAIVKNLHVLVQLNRTREVCGALPVVFSVQDRANMECENSPSLGRSLHTVVGSYLFAVGRLFNSKPLQEYVLQIMDKRKKENQACRYLKMQKDGHLNVTKKRYRNDSKDNSQVSEESFFEREKVIKLLCMTKEFQGREGELTENLSLDSESKRVFVDGADDEGDDEKANVGSKWNVVVVPKAAEKEPGFTVVDFHAAIEYPSEKQHDLSLADFAALHGELLCNQQAAHRVQQDALTCVRRDAQAEDTGMFRDGEDSCVILSPASTLALIFPPLFEVW